MSCCAITDRNDESTMLDNGNIERKTRRKKQRIFKYIFFVLFILINSEASTVQLDTYFVGLVLKSNQTKNATIDSIDFSRHCYYS
jgi:hypothetical protein